MESEPPKEDGKPESTEPSAPTEKAKETLEGSPEPEGLRCPNCKKPYEGALPPSGEILFCPACDAVIPTGKGEGPPEAKKESPPPPAEPAAKKGAPPPGTEPAAKGPKPKAPRDAKSPAKGTEKLAKKKGETKSLALGGVGAKKTTKKKRSTTVMLVCNNCNTRVEVKDFAPGNVQFCEKCDSSLAVEKKVKVGKALGRYIIEEEVGRGGMAVVYKAQQKGLNRHVALKVLLAPEGGAADTVTRLHGEAQAAAKLRHPHIVTVLDVGTFKGMHYIAMDFVDGKPLSDVVGKRRFKGKAAATILKKVAEAIHYAHEQGVIHRDIKPSNILLAKGDEPRIMDFGLAKDRRTGKDFLGKAGVSGTPEYMPPEQAKGQKDIDRRSDVYSLGAVLYALLTGQAPFKGDSMEAVLEAAIQAEPASPRTLNAATPPDLEAICLKAMAKEKEDRYASAKALADDLNNFLNDNPVSATSPNIIDVLAKRAKRNPIAVAAIVILVPLVLVLVGILVFGRGGGGSGETDKEKEREMAAKREQEEEDRRIREQKERWEKDYRTAKDQVIRDIRQIKAQVRQLRNRAYTEMEFEPTRALATIRDATTLILEMGDQVLAQAPEDFKDRLVDDKEVREEAAAKADVLELQKAKAAALGSRGWITWESTLNLENALLDYDEAIKVVANDIHVRMSRGMMYREAGMWQEAYADLAFVMENQPDLFASPENLKYLLMSAIRCGKGKDVESRLPLLAETTGDRTYYQGLLHLSNDKFKEALAQFQEAFKRNMLHGPAHVARCEVLLRQKKVRECVTNLEIVVSQIQNLLASRQKESTARKEMLAQIDLVEALTLRGRARALLARSAQGVEQFTLQKEARTDFSEALRIHPSHTQARKALRGE
jgi:tetratricopeptide (TPR) repeat protein